MTIPVKRKAYAYITYENRLLVFRQPHAPEAGIQVPGGTLEPNEAPVLGVMREAYEETGLIGLAQATFLGEHHYDRRPRGFEGVDHRYFYHLVCTVPPPDRWERIEEFPSEGHVFPLFDLYWVPLPDGVPPLIVDMDACIPQLLQHLGFATTSTTETLHE